MSLSANYPALAPNLLLDFSNSAVVDPRVTVTRASTATYYNGLTYAKAEENLLLQSQDFTTIWGATNVTVTANTTTAPDGTSTAETFDDDVANGVHNVSQAVVTTTGTTYTLSAFLKNVDRQYAILACSGATTSYASAKFDLSAGTLGSTAASGAGWSVTSSSITSVGNGWYRCTITFVAGTTAGTTARIGMATDGTTFTASQRGLEVYTGSDKTIFVWGAQLEQRSSVTAYTATTTQPITNYIQALQTAQNNVPRIDHNPVTNATLGLLIEEQRTNLESYSDDFSNVFWNKNNATVSSNVIIAPDGNLTGDKLITDSGLTTGQVFATTTLAASTTFTFSCFAKAGEWSWTNLATRGPENIDIGAWFNLSAGTVGTVSAGVTASITPVGNGWYRCAVTRTTGTGATASRQRIHPTNADNAYSTGDGYSGIFIWGAQLEAGAFPTSYIPTTTTALTRNADVLSLTGTNFSSWYNQTEGTLFAQASSALTTANIVGSSDGTNNNRVVLGITTGPNSRLLMTTLGSSQASVTIAYTLNTVGKFAGAYKLNSSNFASNGTLGIEDTVCTIPTVDRLSIGTNTTATDFFLNGWISRISYYPLRNTNAQLQALTG